jgi:hypothetical protein
VLTPSTRHQLKQLERKAHLGVRSFRLRDGTRYYFYPERVSAQLFTHSGACRRASFLGQELPQPPEILKAICQAEDRRCAAELVLRGSFSSFYDRQAVIEEGQLVPRV